MLDNLPLLSIRLFQKKDLLKSIVKQKLFDQFIQTWFSQMNNSTRAEFYGSIKNEFKLEPYLLRLNKSENIYELTIQHNIAV
jgi:hypothetical protein